jgi:hypothetical protein
MKIDELAKRLGNNKVDENDERHEIADYLVQVSINEKQWDSFNYYIMLKDKKMYTFGSYYELVKSNELSPDYAYVFIERQRFINIYPPAYLYPFLNYVDIRDILSAYLSKLGFCNGEFEIAPAAGLKYIAMVNHFDTGRLVVEVLDINTVVINTHLLRIVREILGKRVLEKHSHHFLAKLFSKKCKHISEYDIWIIWDRLASQKLFAGYNTNDADDVVSRYYEGNDSLAKEVEAIRDAYNRIFQPYRLVYDLKTKQFVFNHDLPQKPF